jgi:hypothetical protein
VPAVRRVSQERGVFVFPRSGPGRGPKTACSLSPTSATAGQSPRTRIFPHRFARDLPNPVEIAGRGRF